MLVMTYRAVDRKYTDEKWRDMLNSNKNKEGDMSFSAGGTLGVKILDEDDHCVCARLSNELSFLPL